MYIYIGDDTLYCPSYDIGIIIMLLQESLWTNQYSLVERHVRVKVAVAQLLKTPGVLLLDCMKPEGLTPPPEKQPKKWRLLKKDHFYMFIFIHGWHFPIVTLVFGSVLFIP